MEASASASSGGTPLHIDARLAAIAARQHNRLKHKQIVDAGLEPSTLRNWVARGRLIPIYDRVYALAPDLGGRDAALIAAVLASGKGGGSQPPLRG